MPEVAYWILSDILSKIVGEQIQMLGGLEFITKENTLVVKNDDIEMSFEFNEGYKNRFGQS